MTQDIGSESQSVADYISAALSETEWQARGQIARIVTVLGEDAARALLDEAQQVEASGGMLINDKSRRRTPGGVFFYLAAQRLTDEQQEIVWQKARRPHKKDAGAAVVSAPASTKTPPLQWSERGTLYQQIPNTEYGEAKTVKVTLIGRPGKVVERGDLVLTTMKSSKVPALPKGLPTPPSQPTTYALYLSARHWRKVREALQNPEDVLIVEGWQAFDPDLKGIAVWGTNVTTKFLQQQQRAEQQVQSKAKDAGSSA